jgi:fibronectin type 3 domain-containing protein
MIAPFIDFGACGKAPWLEHQTSFACSGRGPVRAIQPTALRRDQNISPIDIICRRVGCSGSRIRKTGFWVGKEFTTPCIGENVAGIRHTSPVKYNKKRKSQFPPLFAIFILFAVFAPRGRAQYTIVNSGSSATFTAPVATATAYAWTLDGSSVGTNSQTFAYSPNNIDVGTHDLLVYQTLATGGTTTGQWGIRVNIPIPTSTITYYVSTTGSDTNSGTIGAPFATIDKAASVIRSLPRPLPAGGVTVFLLSGTYWRTSSFTLSGSDSGTASAPIIYSAFPGDTAVLTTGTPLLSASWSQLALSETNRLTQGVNPAQFWEADASHFTNKGPYPASYGTWPVRNSLANTTSVPDVFYNDSRAWLSRYPNYNTSNESATTNLAMDGVATDITGTNYLNTSGTYLSSTGTAVRVGGAFHYYSSDASHVTRWQTALSNGGLWVQGFWRVEWQNNLAQVIGIDTVNQVIELSPNANIQGGIGDEFARPAGSYAEPYCALNLLEEIVQPDQWAIDFSRSKLYFMTSGTAPPADNTVVVADYTGPVVSSSASYTIFQSLTFDESLGGGIFFNGPASNNLVVGCTFRNLTNIAVSIQSGSSNGVVSCNLSQLGSMGMQIAATGSSNAGNYIVNNEFTSVARYAQVYEPDVNIVAPSAGNRVAHNYVYDQPQMALQFGGHNNYYAYNNFNDYGWLVNDNSGFYSFQDSNGNDTFTYNYDHDTPLASAITYDGGNNRTVTGHFYGNISQLNSACEGTSLGIGLCGQIDCIDNLSIGGGRYGSFIFTTGTQTDINNNIAVQSYYPSSNFVWQLVTIVDGSNNYQSTSASTIANGPNISDSNDPGFVNMGAEDLRLIPNAPIYSLLPNYKPTPFELVGLYNDQYRSDGPIYSPYPINYGGAFVSGTQALLSGTLYYPTFDLNTTVSIYYGPIDGGTNAASWANVANLGLQASGSLSTLVSATGSQPVYYRLFASNPAGRTWAPSTSAAYPSIPTAAGNVTVTPGYAENTITWTSGTYAASYTIERATSPNGPFVTIATGITANSYEDTGIVTGMTYYYVVIAVNATGSSSATAPVEGIPTPGTAEKANNSISLDQGDSWTLGAIPTIYDTALWDGTSVGGSVSVGTGLTANEIRITTPPSAVTIDLGSGGVTLGSGGIDMSAATQNLTFNPSLDIAASQPWAIASGRTLTINGAFGDNGAGCGLIVGGSGTVIFDGVCSLTGTLSILPPAGGLPAYKFGGNNPCATVEISNSSSVLGPIMANGQLLINSAHSIGLLAGSGSAGYIGNSSTTNNILTFQAGGSFSLFRIGADYSSATLQSTGTAPVYFAYFGYNTASPDADYVINGGNWIFNQVGQNNTGAQTSGTVQLASGASVNILTDCDFIHGTWDVTDGTLLFNGGVSESNGNGAGTATSLAFNVADSGGPASLLINGGLTLSGGGSAAEANSATVSNGGLIDLENGALTLGSTTAETAETDTLNLEPGGTLEVNGGIVAASATTGQIRAFNWTGGVLAAASITPGPGFTAPPGGGITSTALVQTSGTLAPGATGVAGKLVVNGTYSMGPAAALCIDIGGTTQATGFQAGQYDYVAVTGSTSLSGSLAVILINNFTPASSQSFTILTSSGGLSCAFANLVSGTVTTVDGGATFAVAATSTSVVLSNYQVRIPPPVITAPPVSGTVNQGQPFTFSVTATGTSIAPIDYQWYQNGAAISSATNSSYGIASAQPANSGTYDVVVSNSGGSVTSASATLSVYVPPPPGILGNLSAAGVQGSGFAYQILASGNPSSYAASLLPAGLSLNSLTGLISGVPAAGGSNSVTIGAANSSGTGTALLSIVIQLPAPVITSPASAVCNAGSAFAYQITATNSPSGFAASGLPTGLTVNPSTGLISGSAALASATTVTISASNAAGVGVAPLALTVDPPITYWSASAVSTAWQTGSNWQGGAAPASSLTASVAGFDSSTYAFQPNAGTTSIAGLQIGDGSTSTAPLTIAGTALSLGAAGINMAANAGAATMTAPLTLGAPQTWSNGSGALLTGSATIATGGNVLMISGTGPIAISASVTGTAGIVVAGSGSLAVNSQLSTAGQAFTVLGGTATLNSGRDTEANVEVDGGTLLIGGSGAPNRYSSAANYETLKVTGGLFSYVPAGGYGFRMNGDNGPASSGNTGYGFSAAQSGGLVSISGGGGGNFNMGNTSGSCSTIYNLSGSGTVSVTNGSSWVLGADTAGSSVTAFNMSGGKIFVAGSMSGSQGTGARQAFAWTGGTLAVFTYTATNLTSGTAIVVSASSNTLVNAGGVLAPGDIGSPGLTTITGNYAVTSSNAVLAIDLSGTTPASAFQDAATTFDRVKITGSANLGGALEVTLINNFVPSSTGTFTILSATSAVTGSFTNVAFGSRLTTTDGLGSFLVSNTGSAILLRNFIQTGPLPTVITAAAGNITGTSALLSGTVNANGQSTTVTFESGTSTAYGTPLSGSPASLSGSTAMPVSCALAGLVPDTIYHFRVDGSSTAGVQDGADMVFTTNPSAPVVTGTLGASGTEGEPFSYQIAGSNDPIGFNATGLPTGLTVNPESGIISGIPSMTGTSIVSLYVSNFGGSGSAPLLLTILPVTPAAPATLSATAGNATVTLDWSPSPNATSYNIRRSVTNGSGFSLIATNLATTSYIDTSATNWTTYYYVATAVGAGGESAYSPEASAMPQSPPFTVSETTLSSTITMSGSSATLYFNNSVTGHTYQLQYSDTLQDGSWQNYGPAQSGSAGTLLFTAPVNSTEPERFYRFMIQR